MDSAGRIEEADNPRGSLFTIVLMIAIGQQNARSRELNIGAPLLRVLGVATRPRHHRRLCQMELQRRRDQCSLRWSPSSYPESLKIPP